jgi:hypothetical protein
VARVVEQRARHLLDRPARRRPGRWRIALRGMLSCSAVSGLCASTSPPADLTSRSPWLPSEPLPDITMQIACSWRSPASERKKRSIGSGIFGSRSPLLRQSWPARSSSERSGGIT